MILLLLSQIGTLDSTITTIPTYITLSGNSGIYLSDLETANMIVQTICNVVCTSGWGNRFNTHPGRSQRPTIRA